MQPEPLVTSAQAFMRWGGQHAQFMGVLGVIVNGVFWIGAKVDHWSEGARKTRMKAGKESALPRKEMGEKIAMLQKEIALLQREMEQDAELHRAELRAANARIAQARAEAIQQTTDRFLLYGYAEEYANNEGRPPGRRLVTKYERQTVGGVWH